MRELVERSTSVLDAVEVPVDVLRYGFDFSAQLLFNLVHVKSVLECDEVDGEAEVTEPTAATDAVQVGLRTLGEVEVDHHILTHSIAQHGTGAHSVQ